MPTTIGAPSISFCEHCIQYNTLSDNTVEVTSKEGQYNLYSGAYSIPSSVTYNGKNYSVIAIGEKAFSSCDGLTSVDIPNSVTAIGKDAFSHCPRLTSITIPNSVTAIGENAFYGCHYLTSVYIPDSVTAIGECAFAFCNQLTSVTIPKSVTSIGELAFYGCEGLTSVTIPDSVTSIGERAFKLCSSLTSITVDNSNPDNVTLGWGVFDDVPTSKCTLYVPKGSKERYAAAEQWKNFKNIVEK